MMRSILLLLLMVVSTPAQSAAEQLGSLVERLDRMGTKTSPRDLIEFQKAIPAVAEIDYDGDERARAKAEAWLLGLFTTTRGEEGAGVRRTALLTLGDVVRTERGLAAMLARAARRGRRPTMATQWIAEALGRVRYADAVHELCGLGLDSTSWRVRQVTLEGLSRLDGDAVRHAAAVHKTAIAAQTEHARATVVSAALRAIGHLAIAKSTPAVLACVGHEDTLVRASGAWALGRLHGEPHVMDSLDRLLVDESPRVREEAVRSLVMSKDVEVCSLLIPRLGIEGRRVRSEIFDGLRALTGEDFDDIPSLWEDWWKANGARIIATPPVVGEVKEGAKSRYAARYYGLPVRSDRILFVLDISMSMRFGGVGEDPPRIDIAKRELERVLARLRADVHFNVLVYSTGNAYFDRRHLVPATLRNKKRAERWIDGVMAAGGTNSYGALKAVFERFPEVDTVYFLSDGRPSRGSLTDPEQILARVKELNLRRRVRIHTIALTKYNEMLTNLDQTVVKEAAAGFMRDLAELTGGTFVHHD